MSWTHLKDTEPVARKPYRCRLCNEEISVGEKHIARTGIWEGSPVTFRMHPECEKETDYWDDDDWECCEQGEMERPLTKEHSDGK